MGLACIDSSKCRVHGERTIVIESRSSAESIGLEQKHFYIDKKRFKRMKEIMKLE